MGTKIIYPDLSYKIIGAAFSVFNKLGYGYKEMYYQRAFAAELEKLNIDYGREKTFEVIYGSRIIGKHKLDFVVGEKIVVELKARPRMGYSYIKQVVDYLRSSKLKLAILISFTKEGVKYRRIINA